jgi:REP element-mobilizing transposase RayT
MPRKPRELVAGGVYHVYARGNKRALIYEDDEDRAAYLELLGRNVAWHGWRCLMYCLMDNHVHLLLETPRPNLHDGMRVLHGSYAQLFNRRHSHLGHVFQGRYGPARWPWSSHAVASTAESPAWLDTPRLLEHFGAAGGDPWLRYSDAVEDRCRVAVSPAACAPNRSPSSPARRQRSS